MWLIGEGRAIRFMILKDIRALLINGVVALWDFKMERTYANLTVRATKKKESRKKTRKGRVFLVLNEYICNNTTHGRQECQMRCDPPACQFISVHSIRFWCSAEHGNPPFRHALARARVEEERGMT